MILNSRFNGPPRLSGRGLVLVCRYFGAAATLRPRPVSVAGPIGRFLETVTAAGVRHFISQYRDHFANPRSPSYSIDLAEAVLTTGKFSSVEVIVDHDLAKELSREELNRIQPCRIEHIYNGLVRYASGSLDCIVLVYPDALGLSWASLEKESLGRAPNVVIVNGRRRMWTLTAEAQRIVGLRRFLAISRLPELLFGMAVVPVAATFAFLDVIRGRK